MRSSCPAGSRRAAAPSLHPIALAVAAFTFSPAWAQTGTAAQQPAEQTPVSAPDELVQEPKALGSITISGARESASTRLPLTPRETPQSTSTVTRAQIERQSLTSIDAVLRNVNGIAVSFYDTQRPLYYARGFQITDFQTDGLPSYSSSTNQEFDTALYERIDIVRELEEFVIASREGEDGVPTTMYQINGTPAPIDKVVAWSRTSRGGVQLKLIRQEPDSGCFRWGLCDPPSKDGDE